MLVEMSFDNRKNSFDWIEPRGIGGYVEEMDIMSPSIFFDTSGMMESYIIEKHNCSFGERKGFQRLEKGVPIE